MMILENALTSRGVFLLKTHENMLDCAIVKFLTIA